MLSSIILSMAMSVSPATQIDSQSLDTINTNDIHQNQRIIKQRGDLRIIKQRGDLRITKQPDNLRIIKKRGDLRI